jgi:hypothetical protein
MMKFDFLSSRGSRRARQTRAHVMGSLSPIWDVILLLYFRCLLRLYYYFRVQILMFHDLSVFFYSQ